MIGKVTFGRGARGLTRYLTTTREAGHVRYVTGDQHEIGATAYRNLSADTPREAAREMALTAQLSTKCEKPFMHLSLSWHPSEEPEEARMIEAMDRMLTSLGLDDRQAVYAVHREKEHQHVHAAVNRVGRDGKAWDRWQCKERISTQCRELERTMEFAPIEQHRRVEHERESVRTPREQRIYERSGVEPPTRADPAERDALRERIGPEARTALRGADDWEQAHERLQAAGIAMEAYAHPKTARTGLQLVEIATGERMPASGLGSDYGRRALEKRLGSFEPSRGESVTREPSPTLEREAVSPARDRAAVALGSLWSEYRTASLEAQRERDDGRREALRSEHRERMERVRTCGFPPALAQALRSECAFEHAAKREALDAVITREREVLREQHRAQSWTAYVVARAERGDERAVEQLWRWNERERQGVEIGQALAQPEGAERTPPVVRRLADLTARVDTRTGEVGYHWKQDGREAFRDRGGPGDRTAAGTRCDRFGAPLGGREVGREGAGSR